MRHLELKMPVKGDSLASTDYAQKGLSPETE